MASSPAALGDARGDRNMPWLAPGRLMVIEVPDVGGWAGALLGRHWSGRNFPRHLLRFKIRHAAPA
jgi:hypothetical protein